jgi:hypothetical protein
MRFLLFLVSHSSHLDANIIAQKGKNREQASFLLALQPSFFTRNQGKQLDLMKTPKAVLKYADRLLLDCGSFRNSFEPKMSKYIVLFVV